MLSAETIVSEAEARAGLDDPERHLHCHLAALVASLNADGALDGDGTASAHRNLVTRTADRLEAVKWTRRHPEILDEPITAPLFLCGLPRSGTTYFQYLIDCDPQFRLLRTWESLMPAPPPAVDPASAAQRKAQWAELRRKLGPREVEGFDALHLIDEDGPDECHAFMEHGYLAAGFLNLYDVPTYFAHLMAQPDLIEAYSVHKRQLQLLQWQAPRQRWAVKYPNHVIAMDSILHVYPDARFAVTHRDPVQVLGSIAKMTLSLRSARYAEVDPQRVGAQMLAFLAWHIDRIMAFVRSGQAASAVHVDYYALVADPVVTMARAYDELGIAMSDAARTAIAGWRRENPKNARGVNDYALERFGIDAGAARERFADYIDHFAIPAEAEGLARGH
ncbi:MAG: sulfotransferase [Sphingomonadales bacterium]|nr:sulfotransferase [Sphingomonadales bacterium]